MNAFYELTLRILSELGWGHHYQDEEPHVSLSLSLADTFHPIHIDFHEDTGLCRVHCLGWPRVEAEFRGEGMVWVNSANHGLTMGRMTWQDNPDLSGQCLSHFVEWFSDLESLAVVLPRTIIHSVMIVDAHCRGMRRAKEEHLEPEVAFAQTMQECIRFLDGVRLDEAVKSACPGYGVGQSWEWFKNQLGYDPDSAGQ